MLLLPDSTLSPGRWGLGEDQRLFMVKKGLKNRWPVCWFRVRTFVKLILVVNVLEMWLLTSGKMSDDCIHVHICVNGIAECFNRDPRKMHIQITKLTSLVFVIVVLFPRKNNENHLSRRCLVSWWWSEVCVGAAGPDGGGGTWSLSPTREKDTSIFWAEVIVLCHCTFYFWWNRCVNPQKSKGIKLLSND